MKNFKIKQSELERENLALLKRMQIKNKTLGVDVSLKKIDATKKSIQSMAMKSVEMHS